MKAKTRKRRTLRAATRRFRRRAPTPPKRDTKERGVLIGGVHDPAEKAADRAADQVMAGKRVTSLAPATAAVHRACADCEDEKNDKKEKTAKRSAGGAPSVASGTKGARASSKASAAIHAMGPGKPLARADRAFFEPRFGRDLSGVRIHDDPAADRAARSIDSRAFALGSDIAFAAGERQRGGARLLGHELAHVAAGRGTARRVVRRATIATEDGPRKYRKVPEDHRADVQKALDLVEAAIKAKKCQDFFKDKCTAGAVETAKKRFDAATIHYLPERGDKFGSSGARKVASDPSIIGYNQTSYEIGRWAVAATLLHEMFHTCILGKVDMEEVLAEQATELCGFYAPWLLDAKPKVAHVHDTITVEGYQLGQAQDANHFVEFGGTKITSYDAWGQGSGGSSVKIEFKVPESIGYELTGPQTFNVVAVNHSTRSNPKPIKVSG